MNKIGTITLGADSGNERTIQLTDILRCEFKDHRLCSVAKCEEGNYVLSVENPASTGRATETTMYLSEGSMMGLLFTIHTFLAQKNISLEDKLKEFNLDDSNIRFECNFSDSPNRNEKNRR